MQAIYEWTTQNPPPEGLVSVVVRMTLDDAADLVTGPDRAEPEALSVQTALRDAVADGRLVLP
jgi:hypothetical protein